ncbi:uncharacterized protein LOC107626990, partial [Arachis ipaensis]|uniref:uncharacterized protein LOC107626990 n=1 Tax=Arachis ipaensis TaxID=130454 RepID=UPI0007AF09A6
IEHSHCPNHQLLQCHSFRELIVISYRETNPNIVTIISIVVEDTGCGSAKACEEREIVVVEEPRTAWAWSTRGLQRRRGDAPERWGLEIAEIRRIKGDNLRWQQCVRRTAAASVGENDGVGIFEGGRRFTGQVRLRW